MTLSLVPGGGDPLEEFYEATHQQTQDATARLNLPPDAFVHWPLPDLNTMLGPMGPGELHYLVAFSGRGKTTLVTTLVDAWLHAGVRVAIAPLEITPDTWRIWLACFRAGIRPGEALQGKLIAAEKAGDFQAAEQRRQIKRELAALSDRTQPWHDLLFVSECRSLTPKRAEQLCDEAADFGADVLIVDHGDHLEESRDLMALVNGVHRGFLRRTQHHGLRTLVTSQCNQDAVKGDPLLSYMAPQPQHVKYGGVKREVATTMTGVFRPLRGRQAGEEPYQDGSKRRDPFMELLRAVRKGHADPTSVLLPGFTGLVCMKNRHDGSAEGQRCYLGYDHGRNVPLTDTQRRELDAAAHAIRTTES